MRYKYGIIIITLIAIIFQQSMLLLASDDKANEIIKKVKETYENLKTFSAEFTQTTHWKLADNVHVQKGTIWLKGKEKFKIEMEDQAITSDGKIICTFSQFNNQVIIEKVSKTGAEVTLPKNIFLNYSEQYHAKYLQNDKIDNQDCYLLELQSKTEDVFIKYMKIWINRKLMVPIKIEQVDLNNNTNIYVLQNTTINKPIADDFFNFKIPESVEIIDMR